MGRYEQHYGTDWDTLDRDAATERAYALGVAEALGEYDREEFEALRAETDTAYDESMVELAFREGKTEGREADPGDTPDRVVWRELVEGADTDVDGEGQTGGHDGLPEAVDRIDAIERPTPDEIEATDRPDFLEK